MQLKIITKEEARAFEAQAKTDIRHIEKLITENLNKAGVAVDSKLEKRLEGDLKRKKRQQARFHRIAKH